MPPLLQHPTTMLLWYRKAKLLCRPMNKLLRILWYQAKRTSRTRSLIASLSSRCEIKSKGPHFSHRLYRACGVLHLVLQCRQNQRKKTAALVQIVARLCKCGCYEVSSRITLRAGCTKPGTDIAYRATDLLSGHGVR
eukprot:1777301-Rhodomonas_salina.4